MRPRTSTLLALGAALVAVACALATAVLAVANSSTLSSFDAADPIGMIMPVTFAAVGVLVATRQPRNATGWLFLFIAVVEGVSSVADQYAHLALVTHPGGLPGAQWALWFTNWSFALVWPAGAAAMLLMLLPDGHLPSPRWRPLAALNLALVAVFMIAFGILNPNPLSPSGISTPTVSNPTGVAALAGINQPPWGGVWFVALAVVVAAAAAPFIRLRRARGDERQQLKWIAYAVIVSALSTAAVTVAGISVQTPAFNIANTIVILLGFGTAVPIAAGIAIFKYGLYEIDVVISRTLVYGTLAVFITAVYVGIAVGIGTLVGSGGKPNLGLSIVATAIVALGFQPVRERVQHIANRLVYGTRATPYEVLSEFSGRVADAYAADEVLPRMAQLLQSGTAAERATVWLRAGDQLRTAATHPEAANGEASRVIAVADLAALSDSHVAAVEHQGETLGALSVQKRRGEALTPIELKLMDDLAHQAGLVLKNVGLTAELMQRLEELRVSRQRLVQAQDEERRRLERNLHDGAQQNLVAFKVKLGLVDMLAAKDPEKAATLLEQLKGDADEALETLRDLARGIYPPLLAEKGLAAALESQARKATLPVTVDAGGIARYPQDVEATVYFCVLEALQNVQKYASASQVNIRLRVVDESFLRFEVVDDGRGFDVATATRGAGLTNMQDRLDAVGGRLDITSEPAHGSTIAGSVPVTPT